MIFHVKKVFSSIRRRDDKMNQNIIISLVMIVKNEENHLERCLKSVASLVDEIIIVDTGSTDGTKEIAQKFEAKIYDFKWCNDFSKARNYALSKATGEYCLVLDADEYISRASRKEFDQCIAKNKIGQLTIFNAFKKEDEINYAKSFHSRFIPKGVLYKGSIHEQIDSQLQRVKLDVEVEHDGYLYISKAERNLEILYNAIKEAPRDSYLLYQLAHTLFVDGQKEGAYYYYEAYYKYSKQTEDYRCSAIVDYLYVIIAVGKLEKGIEIIKKEEKRYSDSPDFNFVCAQFYRELILSDLNKYMAYLPLIEQYYIKCLEIGETTKYDGIIGCGSYAAAYNLGVWYEVSKQFDKAKICYDMASEWGYEKATERLKILG